jgi:protein arginine N-methyltransferase 1
MFADRNRNAAYAAALRSVVRPGCAVLDVGTATGLLAMLACEAGARRIYAVDSSPIVQFARELARHNGMGDRVTFIESPVQQIALPECVDVIVSDVRGVLPLAGQSVSCLIDVRDRWLKPGGAMVPCADTIVAAVVGAPHRYRELIDAWTHPNGRVDASPVRAAAAQQIVPVIPADVEVLTEAVPWVTIDYRDARTASADGSLEWTASAEGTAHGVALWFTAVLAEGVGYSTGPESGDTLYGLAWLPWPEPVRLREGTAIRVGLRADPIGAEYVWSWRTEIAADGRRTCFRQSTFAGAVLSRRGLGAAAARPEPVAGGPSRGDLW